jgi:hypothetical protein
MPRLRTTRSLVTVLCCAALAALPGVPTARANIGPRWRGDVTTEPWGIKEVVITHEQLTIDLRPLTDGDPVRVDVTYHLDNAGASKKLDLLFVSGEVGISEFEARLGERLLESQPLSREDLRRHWDRFPKEWEPPQHLLGIKEDGNYCPVHDWRSQAVPMAFQLELPPGSSTLNVRYRARASGAAEMGSPTVTWQFAYVLAPAREWGGFGRLDVTAYVPAGWDARSAPDLEHEEGVLRGTFTGLPADTLMVAVRAPAPANLQQMTYIYFALGGLTLPGGGAFCWLVARYLGRFLARRNISIPGRPFAFALCIAPFAVVLPLLWAAMIVVAEREVARGVVATFHGQESPYFYLSSFFPAFCCGNMIFIPLVLLIGLAITLKSAARAAGAPSKGMPEVQPDPDPGSAAPPCSPA